MRVAHGWVSVGVAAVALPAGVYFLAKADADHRMEGSFGTFLISTSAAYSVFALLDFTGPIVKTDQAELLDRLDADRKAGKGDADTVADVQGAWREKAERDRRVRTEGALVVGGVGALAVGAGLALPAIVKPRDGNDGVYVASEVTIGLGAILLAMAPALYFSESKTESTYHTWEAVTAGEGRPPEVSARARPATFRVEKPRVGLAPVRGGGGVASFGFSF
jgi:hypothetical protein